MQTIYLVCATCGDYSDRRDWNVCAFLSEAKAKEVADKLNELGLFTLAFSKREASEFDPLWEKSRPVPPKPSDKFLEAKNACALGNGSPTEKKRYALEQENHIKLKSAWQESAKHWWSEREQALQTWRKEHYQLPVHLMDIEKLDKSFRSDAEYYYQAIEVLDAPNEEKRQ